MASYPMAVLPAVVALVVALFPPACNPNIVSALVEEA